MEPVCRQIGESVLLNICGPYLHLELNSPATLNSLTAEFVEWLHQAVDMVEQDEQVRLLLISGRGARGFCAGGNIKLVAQAVQAGCPQDALAFFEREYELDFRLHELETPLVVLANGICMGGGLGIAAAADLVIATPETRMAMPETLIGFFPDVGATRWLFDKTTPGYPEYLGLLGPELKGGECVRTGLATHLVAETSLPALTAQLEKEAASLPRERAAALERLQAVIAPFCLDGAWSEAPVKDAWVKRTFDGIESVVMLQQRLQKTCSSWANQAQTALEARSPTALTLTLQLMRLNQKTPLSGAFPRELNAARFIIAQPDFVEGVRARLIDKDNQPRWRPPTLEEVGPLRW